MDGILKINNLIFDVIQASEFLRLALLPETADKYRNSNCGKSFVDIMDKYAREVSSLPLNYKKKPLFGFVVLPRGEIFQTLSNCPFPKGMCGIKAEMDDIYTNALAVDEIWFEEGFLDSLKAEQKIGLIHELSHVVHSAYFRRMGCLGEGFAEMLPHYLMNIENEKHTDTIRNIDAKTLPVLGFLNKNGMFSNPEDKKLRAQYRSSYLSAYLWMLAYIKRIERENSFNKFEATNSMLTHFAKLEKLAWQERMKGVAEFVCLSENDCFGTLMLQQEGIQYYKVA